VRPKVSGRRALMFLGKPRNARQGFLPALKILGIRLCGPAGIETRFREQRGQQRQAPLLEMRSLSKTVGCERSPQRQKDRAGETVSPALLGLVLSRDHHTIGSGFASAHPGSAVLANDAKSYRREHLRPMHMDLSNRFFDFFRGGRSTDV